MKLIDSNLPRHESRSFSPPAQNWFSFNFILNFLYIRLHFSFETPFNVTVFLIRLPLARKSKKKSNSFYLKSIQNKFKIIAVDVIPFGDDEVKPQPDTFIGMLSRLVF